LRCTNEYTAAYFGSEALINVDVALEPEAALRRIKNFNITGFFFKDNPFVIVASATLDHPS